MPSSTDIVPTKNKTVIPMPVQDVRYDQNGHWPTYDHKGILYSAI